MYICVGSSLVSFQAFQSQQALCATPEPYIHRSYLRCISGYEISFVIAAWLCSDRSCLESISDSVLGAFLGKQHTALS